jgi:hypothetical protein
MDPGPIGYHVPQPVISEESGEDAWCPSNWPEITEVGGIFSCRGLDYQFDDYALLLTGDDRQM